MRGITGFPVLHEALAIELANTLHAADGEPVDGLTRPSDLAAWLGTHREALGEPANARATAAALGEFRALRDVIRDLLEATVAGRPPSRRSVQRLNDFSRRGPSYVELAVSGSGLRATSRSLAGDAMNAAVAAVARSAAELMSDGTRERIRACPAPNCVLYFVKEHPRREWCSVACGNRVRVARHYRRRKAEQTGRARRGG